MVYVDTSAAVPLFVPEPATASVVAWLESCDETLISSDWILTEFARALAIKVRRGKLGQKSARAAWDEFEAFTHTGLRLVPLSRETFLRAAERVQTIRTALRAGDSLHLPVAMDIGASSIATADDQLEKSAATQGLAVNRF